MMKRSIFFLIGVAIEAGALWALCYYTGKRVRWNNTSVYIVFAIGFLTAHWLRLWGKATTRLFSRKKNSSAPIAQKSEAPVAQATQPSDVPTTASVNTVASNSEPPQETAATTPTPPAVPPMRATHMAPPIKMAVQNNAILNINPTDTTNTQAQTPSATPAAPQTPSAQKDKDIAMLAELDPDLDMMPFKHVALEGKIIDLVYSSDDVAVLCKIFSDAHTWTVDTTQTMEECTWTDETGHTIQPCKNLLIQEAALTKMEPDALICPTLVMVRGTIQNYQQV